jgi:NDP-sugar pyrophosphorylase family protein/phosphoheptose isomerase
MKALILAAGEGTRLRPLTLELPKPMLPVVGKPLLEHTIEGLRRQGIVDLAINLNHRPEAIPAHFGDGRSFGVRIAYSRERELLGTAGAAKALDAFLDETFVVVFGDVLTNINYSELIAFHRRKGAVLTLSLYRVDNPTEVGLVEVDRTGRVRRFVEKPTAAEVFTDLANSGVLVCEPEVLSHIPAGRPFDFGQDLLPALLRSGESVCALPLSPNEYLIDIGTPDKYLLAQIEWAALQDGRRPTPTRWKVDVHLGQAVAEAAHVLVDDYLLRLERTVSALSRESIADVVQLLMCVWREGRRVFVMGNGGSAATASHTVNDLNKLTLTAGWPRFKALSLTDNVPLITAWGNDASYDRVFSEPLLNLLERGDVVIGISTSGTSRNVLEALEVANDHGAITVGLTGRNGGRLRGLVDHCVLVPSDHIGRQEDVHQALDHVMADTMRQLASREGASTIHSGPDEPDITLSLVDEYLVRLERVVREMPRDAIADVVQLLMRAWRDGSRVFVMGNGGGAATAAHTVNDLNKLTLTEGWPRFKALSLTDNVPLITAWGNDASYDKVFSEPMLNLLEPGDRVVGISTSGNSPNVLEALQVAREHGAVTIGFTGRDGGRLKDVVDLCIRVPSDHIGRQEDGHLFLNHIIANTMRCLAVEQPVVQAVGAACA